MLAFVDESGDTGRKILNRSSRYFVVAVVVFRDNDDAHACDAAIEQLRMELYPHVNYEFHYAHNSLRVKESFLRRAEGFPFSYHTLVVDKEPDNLNRAGITYCNWRTTLQGARTAH